MVSTLTDTLKVGDAEINPGHPVLSRLLPQLVSGLTTGTIKIRVFSLKENKMQNVLDRKNMQKHFMKGYPLKLTNWSTDGRQAKYIEANMFYDVKKWPLKIRGNNFKKSAKLFLKKLCSPMVKEVKGRIGWNFR